MKTKNHLVIAVAIWAWISCASAQDLLQLPPPRTEGGKPLMQVLKLRQSAREFGTNTLSDQVVSDLLWAAFGISRLDSGKRTAPTARNWQEIDVYVAMASGLFLYDAKANALNPILAEDIRALCGNQSFVKDAPLNLIFVADFDRMGDAADDAKTFLSATDTGFISENVYLYCASEGLATVVRASIDKPTLAAKMKLSPAQKITLSQTVGYPGK